MNCGACLKSCIVANGVPSYCWTAKLFSHSHHIYIIQMWRVNIWKSIVFRNNIHIKMEIYHYWSRLLNKFWVHFLNFFYVFGWIFFEFKSFSVFYVTPCNLNVWSKFHLFWWTKLLKLHHFGLRNFCATFCIFPNVVQGLSSTSFFEIQFSVKNLCILFSQSCLSPSV